MQDDQNEMSQVPTQEVEGGNSNFLADAWFKNQLDFNKGLFSLSGIAVGVIIFLMMFAPVSAFTMIFYIISLLSFLGALIMYTYIYKRVATFLQRLKFRPNATDEVLPLLDKVALSAFIIGTLSFVFNGIFTACQHLQITH